MKVYKSVLGAALLLVSQFTFASGQTALAELTAITLYSGHTGILINHTNAMDPDNCGRQDHFILPQTHPHYKEAYSMLLAMYTAGKKVTLVVDGCYQGLPAIKHIIVSK